MEATKETLQGVKEGLEHAGHLAKQALGLETSPTLKERAQATAVHGRERAPQRMEEAKAAGEHNLQPVGGRGLGAIAHQAQVTKEALGQGMNLAKTATEHAAHQATNQAKEAAEGMAHQAKESAEHATHQAQGDPMVQSVMGVSESLHDWVVPKGLRRAAPDTPAIGMLEDNNNN